MPWLGHRCDKTVKIPKHCSRDWNPFVFTVYPENYKLHFKDPQSVTELSKKKKKKYPGSQGNDKISVSHH